MNEPQIKKIKLDQVHKNNEIPYFVTIKHHKKGKNKGNEGGMKEKDFKDQNHI